MRGSAFISLLLLGACAFGAEQALFDASDGETPFADGVRMHWIESSNPDREIEVVFRRSEDGRYDIINETEPDEPIRNVLFVAIDATPEEDYVAQARLNPESESVVLAFMWREGDRYRVAVSPGDLLADDDLSAADPFCQWQNYQGCGITSREAVFSIYMALIYPNFVAGDLTPVNYLDLAPLEGLAPPSLKRPK